MGEDGKAVAFSTWTAVRDLAALVVRAFVGGIGAAVAMALAILALSPSVQAAVASPNDAKTGTLLLRQDGGKYLEAPRVGMEVAIQVNGIVARTRVAQYFHNPSKEVVDAVYAFPLPTDAAVDRLWLRIGAREIEGRVAEKAEARRTFEKARAEGRKAALVEQRKPNLFTHAVATIAPGETVLVRIEYQQALVQDAGAYRLRMPLAVAPRYVPEGEMPEEPKASDDGDAPFAGMEGCGSADGVDIAVTIDAGVEIGGVESSYHDVSVTKSGRATAVLLSKDMESADRDFELRWELAPGAAPRAALFTERRGDDDYALLMVVPPLPKQREATQSWQLPREAILVVDTSGSMQGASMEQARQALEFALGTLRPADRFNVIEFNSSARALFPAALPASEANLAQAKAWVRGLKAGGGTEMTAALTLALDGRDVQGMLRQVIFVTDGAVGNEDALFKLIEQRLGGSRLFTVGIGSAPNSHFMTKAAQFGRGTFTYIGDVREVHERMARLFDRLQAPVLRDVTVRYADGTPVRTVPERVPDLYLGEPVQLLATARAPMATVIVSGVRGDEPWSVALTPAAEAPAAGVGALWARARIAGLMDSLTRGEPLETVRPEVVKVALQHHLVTAFTSLVAVDVSPGAVRAASTSAVPRESGAMLELPQTDLESDFQLLLGLLALGAAAIVAVAGTRAGASR